MRPAAAGVVLGLALAVGVPTARVLTRPSAAAGATVAEALDVSPERPAELRPDPLREGRPDRLPEATARPATAGSAPPVPVRITAPELGVDARIEPVGVE